MDEMPKIEVQEIGHGSVTLTGLYCKKQILYRMFISFSRVSWRIDETYIKVKKEWKYLYRAVDKHGQTIDFLLTAKRDFKAAKRFLRKAIKNNGAPLKAIIDKSGANTAALESINNDGNHKIEVRQNKYLNNVVEQDHRFIKKRIVLRLGFKNFNSAKIIISGIETINMIFKNQQAIYLYFTKIRKKLTGRLLEYKIVF